jgi:hypothetical protein
MYKVVRMFFRDDIPAKVKRVIKTDLTIEEAQAHCRDRESSSKTCTKPALKAITKQYGPWFDGYEET